MTKPNKSLSVAHLLILTTAAARTDHMIMPLPNTLRARGASQQRLLVSLLKLMLVEEAPTDTAQLSWRTDDQEQQYTLKLTTAGMEAIGGAPEPAAEHPSSLPPTPEQPTAPAVLITQATTRDAHLTSDSKPLAGKLGQVLAAVGAGQGATIDELVTLTGWLPHTTRAALTRLKQRGYPVHLVKQTDRKAYCLTQRDGD